MAGPGFPSRSAFEGDYKCQPGPVWDGGQSTYSGFLAVTMLDRDIVAEVLQYVATSTVVLAKPRDDLAWHPVIHLVGHQRNVRYLRSGVPCEPAVPDYQEMILLIPVVMHGGLQHNFAARMYLDNENAVDVGNAIYAYGKRIATLDEVCVEPRTGTRIWIDDDGYFDSEFVRTGNWEPASAAAANIPRWDDLREYLSMPVLGTDAPLGVSRSVCSYFEWNLDAAQFAPAASRHRFLEPFRDGMDGWVEAGPLESAQDGAIAFRDVRWRISNEPNEFC
jgi:hypothetical protein